MACAELTGPRLTRALLEDIAHGGWFISSNVAGSSMHIRDWRLNQSSSASHSVLLCRTVLYLTGQTAAQSAETGGPGVARSQPRPETRGPRRHKPQRGRI